MQPLTPGQTWLYCFVISISTLFSLQVDALNEGVPHGIISKNWTSDFIVGATVVDKSTTFTAYPYTHSITNLKVPKG